MRIGQVALGFGADDMGSMMIEENVVCAAGHDVPHARPRSRPHDPRAGQDPGAARHALPRRSHVRLTRGGGARPVLAVYETCVRACKNGFHSGLGTLDRRAGGFSPPRSTCARRSRCSRRSRSRGSPGHAALPAREIYDRTVQFKPSTGRSCFTSSAARGLGPLPPAARALERHGSCSGRRSRRWSDDSRPQATSVGVNGDFFTTATGRPSGILLRDGLLARAPPNSGRSSAGIGARRDPRRVRERQVLRDMAERRRSANDLNFLNKTSPGPNGISLFTADWGATTPPIPGSYAVGPLAFRRGDSERRSLGARGRDTRRHTVRFAPGGAVLVAADPPQRRSRAEAPVGRNVTTASSFSPTGRRSRDRRWPRIVRDGAAVFRAGESFATSSSSPGRPAAPGQPADRRIVLVAATAPAGVLGRDDNFELSLALVRLGAVTGWPSTVEDPRRSRSTGRPQLAVGQGAPVSTALSSSTSGVFAPPRSAVVSPDGDGVADSRASPTRWSAPRRDVRLTGPTGLSPYRDRRPRAARQVRRAFPPPADTTPARRRPRSARSRLPAPAKVAGSRRLRDGRRGLPSEMDPDLPVNSTLGYLRMAPRKRFLPPHGRDRARPVEPDPTGPRRGHARDPRATSCARSPGARPSSRVSSQASSGTARLGTAKLVEGQAATS